MVKLEVSVDDGQTWTDAELEDHDGEVGKWTWRFWKAKIRVDQGEGVSILSKATDASGETQPAVAQWNLRGVCYNGYGEARNLKVK